MCLAGRNAGFAHPHATNVMGNVITLTMMGDHALKCCVHDTQQTKEIPENYVLNVICL